MLFTKHPRLPNALGTIHEYSELLAEKRKGHRRSKSQGHFACPLVSPCFPSATTNAAGGLTGDNGSRPGAAVLRASRSCVESTQISSVPKLTVPQPDYEELRVYSQIFEDIISQDSVYGSLLKQVKAKYDSVLGEAHFALREWERRSTATITALSQECQGLKEELDRILHTVPCDGCEHQAAVVRLSKDLRVARIREAKHLELLKALKRQGVPVETVYKTEVKPVYAIR